MQVRVACWIGAGTMVMDQSNLILRSLPAGPYSVCVFKTSLSAARLGGMACGTYGFGLSRCVWARRVGEPRCRH